VEKGFFELEMVGSEPFKRHRSPLDFDLRPYLGS